MPDASVVICTHNPIERIFTRCLDAVDEMQQHTPCLVEVVIVDNCSAPLLKQQDYIQAFVRAGANRRLLRERRTGLTFARLAGVAASHGEVIVFIDDDNIPAPNYLLRGRDLLNNHPEVGVVGPGIIDVEWEKGTPRWLQGYGPTFQAKRKTKDEFGRVAGWPDFFPAGTGMIVRRKIVEEYAAQIADGRLTAADRSGSKMTSAGDAQIVWTGVKMGYSAGTSPLLHLTHFISREKSKLRYIFRLVFGVMASGQIALVESFPEQKEKIAGQIQSWRAVHGLMAKQIFSSLFLLRLRSGPVNIVSTLGELYGKHIAAGRRPPLILRLVARSLGYA